MHRKMKVKFIKTSKEKENHFPYKKFYTFEFSPINKSNIQSNITYSIRFSELYAFHSKLLNKYKKLNFPNFPEKVFFFHQINILKRAYDLENYINKLLSLNNERIINEIKGFLNKHNIKSTLESSFNQNNLKDNDVIDNFLNNISLHQKNTSEILNHFIKENNIFEGNNKFNKEQIYKLFFGNNKIKGLLYYINYFLNSNLLGSINCLFFISKLIDCECNVNYEIYRKIFQLITIPCLKNLKLKQFLLMNNHKITDRVFVIIRSVCENIDINFNDCFEGNCCKQYYYQYIGWLDD